MNAPTNVPSYSDLLWPTLRAVREMGDSGTIGEIVEKVIESEGFTVEQQVSCTETDPVRRSSIGSPGRGLT
jgi:hypothetical protein